MSTWLFFSCSAAVCVAACASDPEIEPASDSQPDAALGSPESTRDAAPDARTPDATSDASRDGGGNQNDAAPSEPDASEPDASEPDAAEPGGSKCKPQVVLNPTVGSTTEQVLVQCDEALNRPRAPTVGVDYDACFVGGPFPLATYHTYVELKNPGTKSVQVELRLDTPPEGEWTYTYLAAYASFPTTEEERNACLAGVNDDCPLDDGLADGRWPCLIGDAAPVVPPGGSIWAYVPQHNPPGQPAGATPARFTLRATVVLEIP